MKMNKKIKFIVHHVLNVVINKVFKKPNAFSGHHKSCATGRNCHAVLSEKGKYALPAKVPWSVSGMHALLCSVR